MIQSQSYLNIADNSGARKIMCIQILGTSNPSYAGIGDIIIGVVKDASPNMPVKRSDVVRAVIINKENNPRGTRVFGPIAKELRDKNFSKIISLAPEVV